MNSVMDGFFFMKKKARQDLRQRERMSEAAVRSNIVVKRFSSFDWRNSKNFHVDFTSAKIKLWYNEKDL